MQITLGTQYNMSGRNHLKKFSKNEEEAIPPGGKYLGTIKASTRLILVHVQKMYKTCTEDVQYL